MTAAIIVGLIALGVTLMVLNEEYRHKGDNE